MQRWSFRRRSLSWETFFDWSEMKVRALPGVSPHPAVRTWPGFQIKWTQPDFLRFFMRTIPAAENRGDAWRRKKKVTTCVRTARTVSKDANFDAPCEGFESFSSLGLFALETKYFELPFEVLALTIWSTCKTGGRC